MHGVVLAVSTAILAKIPHNSLVSVRSGREHRSHYIPVHKTQHNVLAMMAHANVAAAQLQ